MSICLFATFVVVVTLALALNIPPTPAIGVVVVLLLLLIGIATGMLKGSQYECRSCQYKWTFKDIKEYQENKG